MSVPVVLYIPNILGYIRILLAFYGLHQSQTEPIQTVLLFIFSASLDLLDGILARALNQTSSFGILLDIAADNILRTCGWLAAAIAAAIADNTNNFDNNNPPGIMMMAAAIIICLEWTTMLSTQLHAHANNSHWKIQRDNDPWIVRTLFANNFRNPLGILSIYGLFSSYLWAYGAQQSQLYEAIPWFQFFQYTSYAGRAVSLGVEIYMIQSYAALVIENDTRQREGEKETKKAG